MNGLWDILSVAIGISFIFMILSILNSWIQDYISTLLDVRANNLADILQNLLEPGALQLNGREKARQKLPANKEIYQKQKKRPSTHTVRGDETLSSIARDHKDFDVNIADLRNANLDVLDQLPLPAGVTLTIPKLAYTVPANNVIADLAEKVKESIDNLRKPGTEDAPDESTPDTLTSIAQRLTLPIDDLRAANHEVLGELPLKIGDTLKLTPGGADLYTVQASDTIQNVAKDLKIGLDTLQNANLQVLDQLPVLAGTTLTIPERRHTVQANETMNSLAQAYQDLGMTVTDLRNANLEVLDALPLPVATTLKIPEPKGGYTIQANDTVKSIADKYGISIKDLQNANKELKKLNPLEGFDKFLLGKTLRIPRQEICQMTSRKNVLKQLIANPVGSLYSHPIIHSLSKPNALPDRIPTKDFTLALLDLLDDVGRGKDGKTSTHRIDMDSIIRGIQNLEEEGGLNPETGDLEPPPLAFRLRALLYTAQINTQINTKVEAVEASIEEFQKAVSDWFDDTLARGSVWYKRRMQRIGIVSGFILALVLNADTLNFANALWHNAMLREAVTQAAQTSAAEGQPTGENAQLQLEQMANLGLPFGWTFDGNRDDPRAFPATLPDGLSKTIGLLVTGLAISQGSQLWFDLMKRLLNVRSSGLQPESEESAAKDKSKS